MLGKELLHPEQSEGSPEAREMSRDVQHDIRICEY